MWLERNTFEITQIRYKLWVRSGVLNTQPARCISEARGDPQTDKIINFDQI